MAQVGNGPSLQLLKASHIEDEDDSPTLPSLLRWLARFSDAFDGLVNTSLFCPDEHRSASATQESARRRNPCHTEISFNQALNGSLCVFIIENGDDQFHA